MVNTRRLESTLVMRFLFFMLMVVLGAWSAHAKECSTESWRLSVPEKITLYLYPQRLAKLEEHNNTARIAYYIGYAYNDDQFKGMNCVSRTPTLPGWAFDAKLEIMNADHEERLSDVTVTVKDTEVYVEWKEVSDFYQHYDLVYYPFDRQSILIEVSSNYLINELRIEPFNGFNESIANLTSQKVTIDSGTVTSRVQSWDEDKYDLVSFYIHVARDWLSSSVRLGLPMLLIFITALITYIKLKRPATFEPAVGVLGTCQLAIVAYLFVIEQRVPDVGYLTIFDIVTLGMFLIVTVLLTLAIIHRHKQSDD